MVKIVYLFRVNLVIRLICDTLINGMVDKLYKNKLQWSNLSENLGPLINEDIIKKISKYLLLICKYIFIVRRKILCFSEIKLGIHKVISIPKENRCVNGFSLKAFYDRVDQFNILVGYLNKDLRDYTDTS